MLYGQPSRTAMGAAAHRAVHQLVDGGRVLRDPLAIAILGQSPEELRERAASRPGDRRLRFFVAARSELAEAYLAEAIEKRSVTQLVVLGAGLDTFACRSPFGRALTVHEVDHPATQAWKLGRLDEAGIAVPAWVRFAAVDFERTGLAEGLTATGFDPRQRSFFMWLGTVPYLTRAAIDATLRTIGAFPGGSELVFDYAEQGAANPTSRALARRVAAIGEPILTRFAPARLVQDLHAAGFAHCDDHDIERLVERHRGHIDGPPARTAQAGAKRGGRVMFARTD